MNVSQVKNMIILKELPSNIVEEAIVILKNNSKIGDKEKIENNKVMELQENNCDNSDFVIKEAEFIIQDYIKKIEKPKKEKSFFPFVLKKLFGHIN